MNLNQGYIPKDVHFKEEARKKLISGVRKLSQAVKSTLGPGGNTVIIESPQLLAGLTVTKDGVTVANNTDLIDPVENIACKIVKEAAQKTALSAGDGPQPLWSKILTPTGWTTMGEVKVGDVICGTKGTAQTVLGVFDKGELDLSGLRFKSGKQVDCSLNHLWTVRLEHKGYRYDYAPTTPQIEVCLFLKTTKSITIATIDIETALRTGLKVSIVGCGEKYNQIEEVDEVVWTVKKAPMRCIKVSNNDHLYITDGYIPTHNTTSSVVLAEALVVKGDELINGDEIHVLKELNDLTEKVCNHLVKNSKPLTAKRVRQIATISANNDEKVGKVIGDSYNKIGNKGVVMIERSDDEKTYADIIKGIRMKTGYTDRSFINNYVKDEWIAEDAWVLVTDNDISTLQQVLKVLEYIGALKKPLVIVAPCSANFVASMVANMNAGNIQVCIVEPPEFGAKRHEIMQDIAFATGATFFAKKGGMDITMIDAKHLGQVSKAVVGHDYTIFTPSGAFMDEDKVVLLDRRIEEIEASIKAARREVDKRGLKERLACLVGGIGVIKVGGKTEMEYRELYDRVDDAVQAVRAAKQGIVSGGGVALRDCVSIVPDTKAGQILKHALTAPELQIWQNTGVEQTSILEPGVGVNCKTSQTVNMIEDGVIDPLMVSVNALKNATSVATTILSTNAVMTAMRKEVADANG